MDELGIYKATTNCSLQVATSPGCPHEFFTCEELGMVRLYDLRTSSSCHCDGNCNRVSSHFYVCTLCVCIYHWRWDYLGTLSASLLMYSVPCLCLASALPLPCNLIFSLAKDSHTVTVSLTFFTLCFSTHRLLCKCSSFILPLSFLPLFPYSLSFYLPFLLLFRVFLFLYTFFSLSLSYLNISLFLS